MNSYILPITQITKDDAALVGAKAANLGEMHHLGLPIPPAFALTTQCFSDFLTFNRLSEQLRLLLSQTSPQNPEHLSATHRLIEHLFITAPFPGPLQTMLPSAYKSLSSAPLPSLFKNSPPLLAVRSSAVGEDSRVNSFAGQNETFLGVRGEVDLALAIKKCWASAPSPTAGHLVSTRKRSKLASSSKPSSIPMSPAWFSQLILSPGTRKQLSSKPSSASASFLSPAKSPPPTMKLVRNPAA